MVPLVAGNQIPYLKFQTRIHILLHKDCERSSTMRKLKHKACAWRYNYPSCDPNCTKDNCYVTSGWKNVTCKKCLKHKRTKKGL